MGSIGKKGSREVREGYAIGLWKAIRKDWDLLSSRTSCLVVMV